MAAHIPTMKTAEYPTLRESGTAMVEGNVSSLDACNQAYHGDIDKLMAKVAADHKTLTKQDEDGRTPLHWAASGNKVAVVTKLLEASANPDTEDEAGWTALHIAASVGSVESATKLLDVGPHPSPSPPSLAPAPQLCCPS
jgi:ankyrin repeat protein